MTYTWIGYLQAAFPETQRDRALLHFTHHKSKMYSMHYPLAQGGKKNPHYQRDYALWLKNNRLLVWGSSSRKGDKKKGEHQGNKIAFKEFCPNAMLFNTKYVSATKAHIPQKRPSISCIMQQFIFFQMKDRYQTAFPNKHRSATLELGDRRRALQFL